MFLPFSAPQEDGEKKKASSVPDLTKLMNFPQSVGKHRRNGKIRCVMCGHLRSVLRIVGKLSVVPPIIPYDSKGVCTDCQVRDWNVVETNIAIKFCQQCKKFRERTAFLDNDIMTCNYCQCPERLERPLKIAARRQLMELSSSPLLKATGEHREMARVLPLDSAHAQVLGNPMATSDTSLTPRCVPWKGPVPAR
jgi:hypothetical protein